MTAPSCCYRGLFTLLLFKKRHAWVVGTWVIPIEASLYVHSGPEVEETYMFRHILDLVKEGK